MVADNEMKLVTAQCFSPTCKATVYEVPAEEGETHVKCPNCGQANMIQAPYRTLTGRCSHCGKPIDDHTGGSCPK